MHMLKYISVFWGGFICASILFIFLILTDKHFGQFDYGFTNGVIQGHLDAVDAIQKEFGTYDDRLPCKYLFGAYTSDVVSINTKAFEAFDAWETQRGGRRTPASC